MLFYKDIYVAMFILCLGLTIIIFASIPQFTTYIDAQYPVSCAKEPPSEGETPLNESSSHRDDTHRGELSGDFVPFNESVSDGRICSSNPIETSFSTNREDNVSSSECGKGT